MIVTVFISFNFDATRRRHFQKAFSFINYLGPSVVHSCDNDPRKWMLATRIARRHPIYRRAYRAFIRTRVFANNAQRNIELSSRECSREFAFRVSPRRAEVIVEHESIQGYSRASIPFLISRVATRELIEIAHWNQPVKWHAVDDTSSAKAQRREILIAIFIF